MFGLKKREAEPLVRIKLSGEEDISYVRRLSSDESVTELELMHREEFLDLVHRRGGYPKGLQFNPDAWWPSAEGLE